MFGRISLLGASAATLACLTMTGVAQADTSTFSGSVSNGGCDATRPITVNGPSRIEVQVATTAANAPIVYGNIVAPNGSVVAQSRYDTPGAGTYGIQVCMYPDSENQPTAQYTAYFGTGPAGQQALPHSQGEVLGATAQISHGVRGTAALMTRKGLAWFTVNLGPTGRATLKVFNPLTKQHMLFTGAKVSYGQNIVRISKGTMHLTLVKGALREVVGFRSAHFKVSGKVVRGNFIII